MKIICCIVLTLLASNLCLAQKVKTVKEKKVCKIDDSLFGITPVDSFKDSLKFTVKLTSTTEGKVTNESNLEYTEIILNESSILQISNNIAISISVERIEERAKKYYIHRIHMYRKEKKCWKDLSSTSSWSAFNLGAVNSGMSHGNKGSDDFWGYDGTLSLE